jgi:transcriptional regulator with XRE-family HTH domain
MNIKELRIQALRQLIGQQQLKDFANAHDLDPSYLSQILNGHRAMGEKAAATMAAKIGISPNILVNPAQEITTIGQAVSTASGEGDERQALSIAGLLERLKLDPQSVPDAQLKAALISLLTQYQEDPKRGAEIASAILLLTKKD